MNTAEQEMLKMRAVVSAKRDLIHFLNQTFVCVRDDDCNWTVSYNGQTKKPDAMIEIKGIHDCEAIFVLEHEETRYCLTINYKIINDAIFPCHLEIELSHEGGYIPLKVCEPVNKQKVENVCIITFDFPDKDGFNDDE